MDLQNKKSESKNVIIIKPSKKSTQKEEPSDFTIFQEPFERNIHSSIVSPQNSSKRNSVIKVNDFYHLGIDKMDQKTMPELKQKNCVETQTEDSYFKTYHFIRSIKKNYYKSHLFRDEDVCQYTPDEINNGKAFQFSFGQKLSMDNNINSRLKDGKVKQKNDKELYSNPFYMNNAIEKFKMGYYRRKHSFGCQADRFSDKKFFDVPNNPLGPGEYHTTIGNIENKQNQIIMRENLVNGSKNKYAENDWTIYKRMRNRKPQNKPKTTLSKSINNVNFYGKDYIDKTDALAEQMLKKSEIPKKVYTKHKIEKFGIVLVEKIRFDTDSYDA